MNTSFSIDFSGLLGFGDNQGPQGDKGDKGDTGPQGSPGQGVQIRSCDCHQAC